MTVLPGFPLLPDSDDEDNCVELPNGQLVCCRHALVVCGKCCMDYSFTSRYLSDEDASDDDYHCDPEMDLASHADATEAPRMEEQWDEIMGLPKNRRGTGRVLPTRFVPPSPSAVPFDLFQGVNTYYHFARYVDRNNRHRGLIFTDGACLDNGKANPRAGWGFVAGPPDLGPNLSCGNVNGRLETEGPFGDAGAQTSNRAELRAVIAALGLRHWPGEGFRTIVFATDSEYVVEGATKWVKRWLKNGWKTARGEMVKNKDLWEMLLGEVERFGDAGMRIEFWRIERGLNVVADGLAKKGAAMEDGPKRYSAVIGM